MNAASHERHVYHIGPWRYVWVLCGFGAVILFFLAEACFCPVPGERAGLLIVGGCLLLALVFVMVLVRFARLEISEAGVRLRQSGYRLEAPWNDIIRLRPARGREAFVTSRPVGGKGAGLLAAAAHFPLPDVSLYDAEQLALLDEHRLIPIEAFAWHLRHGKLRAQIERFAPHLCADLALLDAPAVAAPQGAGRARAPRPPARAWTARQWAVLSLIPLLVAAGVLIGRSSHDIQALARLGLEVIFQAGFSLYLAGGAREFYRRGSWLFGSGMLLVSVLLGLWALASAGDLAARLGAGAYFMQVFVTWLFALLALGMSYGTWICFRRRRRVLGVLCALAAIFLALCALGSGLDIGKRQAPGRGQLSH